MRILLCSLTHLTARWRPRLKLQHLRPLHLPSLYGAEENQKCRKATGLCYAKCFSLLCSLASYPLKPCDAKAALEENTVGRQVEGDI